MRTLRLIFLVYLAWLLVIFLPAHTRGQITLGARDAAKVDAKSCCDDETPAQQPTSRDRANCAVCYWAAGILPTAPFVFHVVLVEQALERAHAYAAQVRAVACRLNQYGRDPPSLLV